MTLLTRYEIHVDGSFLQGAVLAGVYTQKVWEQVCEEVGIDPEEAEEISDEYELIYPSLPKREYLFWFTPEGDNKFHQHYGHLIAEAMAIHKGGNVIILQREYNSDEIIYEDKDQVVYLR